MDIKEITKVFENQSSNSYFLFETLVLKLLTKHLEEQNKPFVSNIHIRDFEIDGLANEGIDDLSGPTLVEIKLKALRIVNTLNKIYLLSEKENYQSILLIFGTKLPARTRKKILDMGSKLSENIYLEVWDIEELSDILKKYPEYVSNILPSLKEFAISNVVTRSQQIDPLEWKMVRERHIEQLKKAYSDDDLVLFLGAGVSLTANMPDWNSLISKLMVTLIGKKFPDNINVNNNDKKIIANGLQRLHNQSPLLEARYIRAGFGKSFTKELSKFLYDDLGKDGRGTSILLKAIARLCIPKRSGPGIRAIVNYNFDDLMENHLEDMSVRYHPIFRDVDIATQDELGVYHVHGFLPRNIENYNEVSESLIVFSEEGYHTLFMDSYSWSNIIQLNYFRESTCLMVGLSVTDPNLRRLLDIAARKNNRSRHYVIFKRVSPSEFLNDVEDVEKEIKSNVIEAFLKAHHELQEASFQELNLNIIWVENFDELPNILDSIKN